MTDILATVSSLTWSLLLVATLQATPGTPQPAPAEEPWPDDKPFTRIIDNLVEDVRGLWTQNNGLLLASGVLGALVIGPADDDSAEWAAELGNSSPAKAGRAIGDAWAMGATAAGTYAFGRVSENAELTHIGSDLVRAQVLNAIITKGAKYTIQRERPNGGRHSMPSGHSSASFASASVLHSHYGWRIGAPAYAVATFIGLSSIRDGAHWVSDVAAGATIGLIVGHTVTRGHRERDWQIVPVRTPGGVAVLFIRRP